MLSKDLGFSNFHRAILTKSLTGLKGVLQRDPSCVNEILPGNQSGAHAAASWQEGPALLIQANVDINGLDYDNRLPIESALKERNTGCAKQLLKADCTLANQYEILSGGLNVDLEMVINPLDGNAITKSIVDAMVNRARRLNQKALEILPGYTLRALNISREGLPDFHAYNIQEALRNTNIQITPAIIVHREESSIWDSIWVTWAGETMSVDMARYLWDQGFRDLDEAYRHRQYTKLLSPLHYCSSDGFHEAADLTAWLYSKFSISEEELFSFNLPVKFAAILGRAAKKQRVSTGSVSDSAQDFFAFLFRLEGGPKHQQCRCACSLSGCTALDRYYRGYEFTYCFILRGKGKASWVTSATKTPGCTILKGSGQTFINLIPAVIRACLFYELSMVHTCCGWERKSRRFRRFKFRNPVKTGELRDEHSESIATFEERLEQVLAHFRTAEMDLFEWLEGPFSTMAKRFRALDREPKEGHIEGVYRDSGVQLTADGYESCEEDESSEEYE